VPIAINALTGDMMGKLGVSDTDDVEALYPNLSTHNTSSANSGFTIRGVGTDNFHISGQQSVTTYIDDVGLTSPFISTIGVFDTERVEVLRGPQNTLYGRNTIGGAVNFHSVRPEIGGELNGKASVGYGSGGEREIELAVGAPLGDSWAFRLAGKTSKLDGHLKNLVNGEDVGGYDRKGIRAMLAGDLSEKTSLLVSVYTGEADGDSSVYLNTGSFDANGNPCSNDMDVDAILSARGCTYQKILKPSELGPDTVLGQLRARDPGLFVSNANGNFVNLWTPEGEVYAHPEGGYHGEHDGINVYLEHELANMTFNSITSYSETSFKGLNFRSLHGFGSHQEGDWESFTQELRLTSNFDGAFQFLAGLYYNNEDSLQDTWVNNAAPPPGLVNPLIAIDSEYENFGAYVQLDYNATENLSFTAGLRYTSDSLDGQWAKYQVNFIPSVDGAGERDRDWVIANDPDGPVADVPNPTQELSEVGWKLGFDYRTDFGMVYGSVSTGFKGGAYDNRALSNGSNPIGPEFVDAYELGFKSMLLDDTIELNVAAFLYFWEDQQLFETNPVTNLPETLNIAETELKGFEVDMKWAPVDNFYIQGGFGITDSEITDPGAEAIAANSAAEKGDEVPNVPRESLNVLAVYTVNLNASSIDIQGSYRYAGSYYHNFQQDLARTKVEAHDWLNARVTYNFGNEQQYSIGVYGNNLTGEYYCSDLDTGLPSGNIYSCQIEGNSFGEPTYGVSLSAEF